MGREEQYQASKILLALGVLENKNIPEKMSLKVRCKLLRHLRWRFLQNKDVAMVAYLLKPKWKRAFGGICQKVYYVPQYRPLPKEDIANNVSIISGAPKKSVAGNG